METKRYFYNALEKTYNKVYSHPKFNEFLRESIEELEVGAADREKRRRDDEEFKKLKQDVWEFIRTRIC